jgi:SAM-dependent methyltransferase
MALMARTIEPPGQFVLPTCPLCGLDRPRGQRGSVIRCGGCSLAMRVEGSADDRSSHADQDDGWSRPKAARYFDRLAAYRQLTPDAGRERKLLVVGSETSAAVAEARARGYHVTSVEPGTFPSTAGIFDVCVLADAIERTADPLAMAVHAWDLLAPGGTLFVTFHSRGRDVEHLLSFDRHTAESLVVRAGFDRVRLDTSDGIVALAQRTAEGPIDRRCPVLSVVLPVFNERATFSEVATQLLAKRLTGFKLQLIIIESNSTDGTREEVRRFEADPRVTVIYEDRPRGKGHAVRAGLARATGDFVLIQDADLEYDLDDYERLLEPLRTYRHALVLGSRHGANASSWQLRQFAEQPAVSRIMNVAHVGFTWFFDTVYGTRLRDPFTMFKVFRRECLSGLTFESNRFDFDWELLAKLVRAGYTPVEIPVRYRSRSYREGKKIRFWRDPLTWVRACLKYRFVRLEK